MNKTEQGVLQPGKLSNLLIQFLLLITCCVTPYAYAGITDALQSHNKKIKNHHVVILYSPSSTLQSNITTSLLKALTEKRSNLIISTATPEDKTIKTHKEADIVIAIGEESIHNANKQYPETDKLFLSTDPEKYSLDTSSKNSNAVLYMTQSYCRQIRFIKYLSENWKTIGLLNSREKPINTKTIKQCAKKHGLETYIANTTGNIYLKDNIKKVLNHSDILLALPDKSIYNSKSVKNILLTSYRHRKPIIAFSKNFVNAGALASIYSSPEQIAQSASKLIEQYFTSGQQFKKPVNYPQEFDTSINRQVFRALNLTIPDLGQLKKYLRHSETYKSGERQ